MKRFVMVSLVFIMGLLVSCYNQNGQKEKNTPPKQEILVLHAGSLALPFQLMAKKFTELNPEIEVKLESHGSLTCARQVTELNRAVDVLAVADAYIIGQLLIPAHADFCIDFTTNEMVIMYNAESKYASDITGQNWFKVLLRPDVQYGHSDPNSDPCGYRALLSWQLAEKYYRKAGLYKKLQQKMPVKNIRAKEVDLLALLDIHQLDYIFIYRSVAEQHQCPFIKLPDEVNLKSPLFAELYGTVSVKIVGTKPGEWIDKKGSPMVYGLTIPKKGANQKAGIRFVEFILGKEGQAIMAANGQPEIVPAQVDYFDKLPQSLRPYCIPKK